MKLTRIPAWVPTLCVFFFLLPFRVEAGGPRYVGLDGTLAHWPSGTTAIACIRLNRKYILIEKEEKYCEIIAKRIDSELDQTDIFRSEE